MARTSYSCVIPVKEERVTDEYGSDDFWVLTSEVLPGFVLGGRDLEELHAEVPEVIRFLFKENFDMNVEVRRVTAPESLKEGVTVPNPKTAWTAFPLAA